MGKAVKGFTLAALLIGVTIVAIALVMGGQIGGVEVGPQHVRVDFDNSAAKGATQEDVAKSQPALADRVIALEDRARSDASPAGPLDVDVSGTWRGANGFIYFFSQYENKIVLQEQSPYGITAVGYGYVDGNSVYIQQFYAANGTFGRGSLTASGHTLSGSLANSTYGYIALTMQRA